jgi:hypothetical protein
MNGWTELRPGVSHSHIDGHDCEVSDYTLIDGSNPLAVATIYGRTGTDRVYLDAYDATFSTVAEAQAWCTRQLQGH